MNFHYKDILPIIPIYPQIINVRDSISSVNGIPENSPNVFPNCSSQKKNWSEVTSCLRDELQSFVVDELQVNHATSLKMFICNIFLWTFEHVDFWVPKHHDNFENLLKSDPG
jgi:hypothetical protein